MREMFMFYAEILRRWRVTGAIGPSGPVLARAMADAVGPVSAGQVILELGPGTGVFTRELVRRFPTARVVAVELNERFAGHLRAAVPGATVVNGCASRLDAHLAALGHTPADVAAVVSGLPILIFPGDMPRKVFNSISGALRPGRRFVQFTYFQKTWLRFDTSGFRLEATRRVWRNIPPAVVLPFTRTD